jgi:hypothetical protein
MKTLISILVFITLCKNCIADSPLTSTYLWKSYDHPMINRFHNLKGEINKEHCNFLMDKRVPLEIRIAAVNALGWNINGQKNAEFLMNYLVSNKRYNDKNNFVKNGNSEELIIYAYMLAMDNYFDVSESLKICNQPIIAQNQSKCIQIISALIKSHSVLNKNYCDVYQILYQTNKRQNLKDDMKSQAIDEIFKYINIYEKYCEVTNNRR